MFQNADHMSDATERRQGGRMMTEECWWRLHNKEIIDKSIARLNFLLANWNRVSRKVPRGIKAKGNLFNDPSLRGDGNVMSSRVMSEETSDSWPLQSCSLWPTGNVQLLCDKSCSVPRLDDKCWHLKLLDTLRGGPLVNTICTSAKMWMKNQETDQTLFVAAHLIPILFINPIDASSGLA